MNTKAYRIFNKTSRVTESRNAIFIDNSASKLVESTGSTITGDAVNAHEDSSSAENTDDARVTYNEEVNSLLKKLSNLTSRNMDHSKHQLTRRRRPLKAPEGTKHSIPPERSIADSSRTSRCNTYEHTRKWCRNSRLTRRIKPPPITARTT